MASNNRNYSILVGIKLDTGDVQKQLDEIKGSEIKFKVTVDGKKELDETVKAQREAEKAAKKAAKEQEKAAKKAAKEQEKAAKEAAKAEKKALKEREKAQKDLQNQVESLGLTYQQANAIMQASIEVIGRMIDSVFELDDALTEFKKVSDLSGASLDAYVDKLAQMGLEVGRTGKPQGQSRGVQMVNVRQELFKIQ